MCQKFCPNTSEVARRQINDCFSVTVDSLIELRRTKHVCVRGENVFV